MRSRPAACNSREERREFDGVGRDRRGIRIVEQVGVILRQHERRGRLGADNPVAFTNEVGQNANVAQRRLAGSLHIADRELRHPAPDLPRRNVHLDAVVLKHRDRRHRR